MRDIDGPSRRMPIKKRTRATPRREVASGRSIFVLGIVVEKWITQARARRQQGVAASVSPDDSQSISRRIVSMTSSRPPAQDP